MKSFYAKSLILFCFFVSFSVSVFAQENCVPIAQTADVLLNLQIGMSVEQVSNKLGKGLKIKTKKKGDYRYFQNYINKKPPQNLVGVRAFYLRFFEKKLYQAEIFYDENKYPTKIKDFAGIISNQLNLPIVDWKFTHKQAVFKCGESSLVADYQLNPRIELTNDPIKKQVDEINKKTKLF